MSNTFGKTTGPLQAHLADNGAQAQQGGIRKRWKGGSMEVGKTVRELRAEAGMS